MDGISGFAFNTMVSGPGQKRFARAWAWGGTSSQYSSMALSSGTMRDSGLTAGLPFTS